MAMGHLQRRALGEGSRRARSTRRNQWRTFTTGTLPATTWARRWTPAWARILGHCANMNGAPLTRTRPRRSWGRGPSTSGVAAKSGPSVDVSSAASCAAPTAEPAQSAQLSVCVTLPPLVRDVVRLWLQYFPIAIPHYCRMTPGARWQ